ncbi:MAG: 16S rRNA (adenine(1518)-N(6)/adenine(1519)-N(6))-dimethyltransferase RsmA [Bacteroidetes bacterium]|nr:16S rRNA (adenine(1518)-N(6)/adenine(1519)-N(6))-dimethyltransferase RsmA [Bacteroidota bacterium]
MMNVRAKKHLGQHFLKDEDIALQIVKGLTNKSGCKKVLEVGPGMGVLTKYLLEEKSFETYVIDIDRESISFLQKKYPLLGDRIIAGDFLQIEFNKYFSEPFLVIGNFPYNISTEILFKVLDNRNQVPEVVGMFQKEVAERIASKPGNKVYGIVSVLLQAFYDIEYLFTVEPEVFDPPPKVRSGVIRLIRNTTQQLDCDEKLFIRVVKATFGQRRKMVRNGIKQFKLKAEFITHPFLTQRPEQLSVKDFVELTNMLDKS